ncbi:TetR/AcrR family transcriptional regulator [Lysinimonas soli]|uniref:TetR/AcrR family transcriptional regulator n=1 Tax=Lysinimonas soli TaxID=1074233 RepID=A0ABW0NMJ7_9MICO
MTIQPPETATRMRSDERRELILAAATSVFGERGYVGTTTDAIARAAGVSQPYVVRMFGTKEALFLEVLQRALDRLLATFRAAIADPTPVAGPDDTLGHRIGMSYAELLLDRGLLLSLMHSFLLGADPVIGAAARAGFLSVYRLLREEAGFSAEETDQFLAHGMMMNTMVGLRMADEYADGDPCAKDLLETAMPQKLELLLRTTAENTPA